MSIRVEVKVDPVKSKKEFALVSLHRSDIGAGGSLYVDYVPIRRHCTNPRPLALDFLLIASSIYAIDKQLSRDEASDAWTREITVSIPVSDPESWSSQVAKLNQIVSFLTGDLWSFEFEELESKLPRPKLGRKKRFARLYGQAVSLFSGGLDSLIGAIDWLEANPEGRLVLVGHHDPKVPGPNTDQLNVFGRLKSHYPSRITLFQVGVGPKLKGEDRNYRSRSILFIALGVVAATSIGTVPLLVPENGPISLNVPLSPSRRGSCSTRTTHPFFLEGLEEVLAAVGIPTEIVNTLLTKTKGESMTQCLGQAALSDVARITRSCAKRGHTSHWGHRTQTINGREEGIDQCGCCMPCIFRRGAMHAAGMDDEVYGNDICIGEVDIEVDEGMASDLRAVLSFCSHNFTRDQISSLLISNGPIDVTELDFHATTVARAFDEVRQLLRDKAIPSIKSAAGV